MKRFRTDYLTARPSYLTGAGTVFNLAGSYYRFNAARSAKQADARAIYMDWAMIGQDLRKAMASLKPDKGL
jgi:hypothetical protein